MRDGVGMVLQERCCCSAEVSEENLRWGDECHNGRNSNCRADATQAADL